MARRPQPTFADYVVIALSPALIMALVGSLVFFLIEVFYRGHYDGRLTFIMAMFVMAAVLIARISIEESREYAALFALPLAIVTAVALQRFVSFSGPLGSFSLFINLGLMALIWWCADRLTWDSTVIDESQDASGEGLLQTAGLDAEATTQTAAEDHGTPGQTAPSLWQRFVAYRRRPHAPGVWVIYFSLAALPIFGFGHWFIPSEDLAARRYVFKLLVAYVAAGLGLLLTTSFLNLRRYLRQRRLEMPASMATAWIGTGAAMIVALLLVCMLLPRRNAEYALTQLPIFAGSPTDLWTTEWSVGNEGELDPEQGDRPGQHSGDSPSPGDQQPPGQEPPGQKSGGERPDGQPGGDPGSGGQPPGGKGPGGQQPGGGPSGEGKSGEGKSGEGNSDGGQSGGEKSDGPQSGNQKQGDSGSQSGDSRTKSPSPQSDRPDAEGKDRPPQPQGKPPPAGNEPEQQPGDSRNQPQQESPRSPPSSAETPPPDSSPRQQQRFDFSKIPQAIGGTIGSLLKFLYWVVAGLIVAFLLWKYWQQVRDAVAQFWKSLQDFWASLFGGRAAEADAAAAAESVVPVAQPFASFQDPFLTGMAQGRPPAEIVRYSFAALEAWARERGSPRGPEQTPHEFALQVGASHAKVARDVGVLAELYNRCAYGRESGGRFSVEPLRRLWQQMRETPPPPPL